MGEFVPPSNGKVVVKPESTGFTPPINGSEVKKKDLTSSDTPLPLPTTSEPIKEKPLLGFGGSLESFPQETTNAVIPPPVNQAVELPKSQSLSETEQPKAKLTKEGWVDPTANIVDVTDVNQLAQRAVTSGVSQTLRGLSALTSGTINSWANTFNPTGNAFNESKATNYSAYKAADWLEKNKTLMPPVSPELESSIGGQLIEGGVNLGMFAIAGELSEAAKLGSVTLPAMFGGFTNAGQEYKRAYDDITDAKILSDQDYYSKYGGNLPFEEVIAAKNEKAQMDASQAAFDVSLPAAAVGTLDALPITSFLKRANGLTGGIFAKVLGSKIADFSVHGVLPKAVLGGLEEGISEATQQYLTNLSANEIYDKTRSLYEGVTDNGGIGFTLGFMLNGMAGALTARRHNPNNSVQENIILDKTLEYVHEKQNEIKDVGENEFIKPSNDIPEVADLKQKKVAIESDLGSGDISPDVKAELKQQVDIIDAQINQANTEDIANKNTQVVAEGEKVAAEQEIQSLTPQLEQATSEEAKAIIQDKLNEQLAKVEALKEIIPQETNLNKEVTNDKENISGVQGNERIGQESIQTELNQSGSPQEVSGSGILQASQKEINPILKDVESTTKALEDGIDNNKIPKSELNIIIDKYSLSNPETNGFNKAMGEGWKQGIENGSVSKEQVKTLQEAYVRNQRKKIVSEAYHKAKEDNSNPELIKEVEGLFSSAQDQSEKNVSQKELISELRKRKEDNAIHADIFQNNGYVVHIFDNKNTIEEKKFKTHEEAKKFLNEWSEKNGDKNKIKYDYGTIQDIANFPYRLEITGSKPEINESNKTIVSETINQLEKLKIDTKNTLGAFGLAPAAWNTIVDGLVLAVKGGMAVNTAIKEAIAKAKEISKEFDEKGFAAKMNEIFGTKEEPQLSGIKKALVPEDVIDSIGIDRRSQKEMLKQGQQAVEDGTVKPEEIVYEIAHQQARALQPIEVAALVYYKTQLDNKVAAAYENKATAEKEGNYMDGAAQEAKIFNLEQKQLDYQVMQVKTAYEQSLAFSLRKMLLDSEYNLQAQIAKYRANNNGTIPPHVKTQFEEYDRQLQELNAKLEQLETEKRDYLEKKAVADLLEAKDRESKKRQTIKEETKRIANKIRQGKINRPSMFLSSSPAAIAWDGAIELAATAFEVGGNVAQAIKNGLDHIKSTDWYKGLDSEEKDAAQNQFRDFIYKKSKTETGATVIDGNIRIPHEVIRKHVEKGVNNIEDLTKAVMDEMKDEFPDITERDVRDAITGYGKTVNQSKDEIEKEIHRIKRIGKLINGLEDVRQKMQRPLRSGLQKDALTAQELAMAKELHNEMKKLPPDIGETSKAWKTALEGIKTRLRNSIEEITRQLETGEKTSKKMGVTYDAEALALKAQKNALKEQLEAIEGKQEMSPEQSVKVAVAGLERSIKNLEEKIATKNFEVKKKLNKTPQTTEIKALKSELEKQKTIFKELQKEAGIPEKVRLERYKVRATNQIKALQEKLDNGDFSKKPKLPPMDFDAEAQKLEAEKIRIKEKYDYEEEKLLLSKRSTRKKIWDGFIEMINLPKSLITTLDMSAPLRQGLVFTLPRLMRHPIKTTQSFVEMFKYAFDEKYYEDWLANVKASSNYPLIKNSKLYLSESNGKASAREEALISSLPTKIPLLKFPIKASARAYTGFLNQLRVDVFTELSENFISQGLNPKTHPKEFEALAKYVNNATGRGGLGEFESAATDLATAFFSPRLITARLNILFNPLFYAKMPPKARKQAVIETTKFLASMMIVSGLAYLYASSDDDDDTTFELDPRSSDWLKLRIGDTRMDYAGGFQQFVRVGWQTATGEKKSTNTGKIEPMGLKYGSETTVDNLIQFGKNKLSPVPSALVKFGESHINKNGQRVDKYGNPLDVSDIATDFTIPLYASDLYDIYKAHGLKTATVLGLGSFFGVGVSNYEPKKPAKTTSNIR